MFLVKDILVDLVLVFPFQVILRYNRSVFKIYIYIWIKSDYLYFIKHYINGLAQDCVNSSANALELIQSSLSTLSQWYINTNYPKSRELFEGGINEAWLQPQHSVYYLQYAMMVCFNLLFFFFWYASCSLIESCYHEEMWTLAAHLVVWCSLNRQWNIVVFQQLKSEPAVLFICQREKSRASLSDYAIQTKALIFTV